MPLFLRTLARRTAPALRGHTVSQTANVYSKPAKEKIGPLVLSSCSIHEQKLDNMKQQKVISEKMINHLFKDGLCTKETALGIGTFALAILGPSGWILSHLEEYKKKE